MRTLQELTRKNIWNLAPYSCARDEFKGEARVFLDANENPHNGPMNRYPDPLQSEVKAKLALVKGVSASKIFLGVGSDECIDLCYRVFCEPRIDNVVAISPTYGMYQVCADVNDVEYRKVALNPDFTVNIPAILAAVDAHTKVMWICSPNNPTGNSFPITGIRKIYDSFDGILVVDEAYIDFASQPSMTVVLSEMPRMIVMQTFSKAWASAAARLGIAYADEAIISLFNKVKYPYNVNRLTQQYALELLDKTEQIRTWVAELKENREVLIGELSQLPIVKHIYPTDANFVLVQVDDADALYSYLCNDGIIVRNRNRVELCLGCVRITIGTTEENRELIKAIKAYSSR